MLSADTSTGELSSSLSGGNAVRLSMVVEQLDSIPTYYIYDVCDIYKFSHGNVRDAKNFTLPSSGCLCSFEVPIETCADTEIQRADAGNMFKPVEGFVYSLSF